MAMAMLLGAQHVVAKSTTMTNKAAKKHHKHHTKKAAIAGTPALTA
jgi:hypothetical protein